MAHRYRDVRTHDTYVTAEELGLLFLFLSLDLEPHRPIGFLGTALLLFFVVGSVHTKTPGAMFLQQRCACLLFPSQGMKFCFRGRVMVFIGRVGRSSFPIPSFFAMRSSWPSERGTGCHFFFCKKTCPIIPKSQKYFFVITQLRQSK